MATLLDDKSIINNLLKENTANALSDYSEKLDSAPSFISYFNKNISASTNDINLDNVYQVTGSQSPVLFNMISDFPIYGLSQISLDLSEGNFGAEAEVTSECVILPGTITPLVDDMIEIPYNDGESITNFMFRVTNVSKGTIASKRFFKLNIILVAESVELIKEQVTEELVFNVTDYEENRTPILIKSDAIKLDILRDLNKKIKRQYIRNYIHTTIGTIVFKYNNGNLVNFNLNEFIESFKLLTGDRTFFDGKFFIIGVPIDVDQTIFFNKYKNTIYYALENKSPDDFNFDQCMPSLLDVSTSMLCTFGEVFYECLPATDVPECAHYVDALFKEKVKTNTFYEEDNKIAENIIIKYINNGYTDLNNLYEDLIKVDSVKYSLKEYYLTPCILFLHKKVEEYFLL